MATLRAAITPFTTAGQTVLDPCCGMGYTAKFALENNLIFRGNEINGKRLQCTIDKLEKAQ